MTQDQIEAMLAMLARREEKGDCSGVQWVLSREPGEPGEHVRFEDVREVLEALAIDAARYRWLRDDHAYGPEENGIRGGEELDEYCDGAIEAQRKAG